MNASTDTSSRAPRRVLWLLIGVGLTVASVLVFEAVRYVSKGHPSLPPVAKGVSTTLVDDPINKEWVVEGNPQLKSSMFFQSLDGKISAGLWEATGPAKFKWQYGVDETVLVLEGSARLTYDGQTTEVNPGSSVFFRAGEEVLWEVPDRIKKTWVLHEPGMVARKLRPGLSD